MTTRLRIAVIGLGYVGLPLAVALARSFEVVGFDASAQRLEELGRGYDRTGEVPDERLQESSLRLVSDPEAMRGADVFIVTVPTPVNDNNLPDLASVRAACRTAGRVIAKGGIVVLESTVYPGVTEDICGPEIEAASGLRCGVDFFLGYSPERINPGDRQHTVDRITKVVSGQTPAVAAKLAEVYGAVNGGKIFIARDIKTAEAAKVIENAQRDINIAFINEVTMIFNKMGLSVHDVLAASATKWNFLPFAPGFVGGHCIGVDPFYLAHLAHTLGHHPEIILAGRRINDGMGGYVANAIAKILAERRGNHDNARILVLGLTFKENIPDLRNSKVVDLIKGLRAAGHVVEVHDPHADPAEAKAFYRIDLQPELAGLAGYDCVVGAVAHDEYRALSARDFARIVKADGLVADVKGMWRKAELPATMIRWEL
ncbi:MAG TPA: nucleotide sugar dehydrogenase [Alphaproteobacteria bacterium]|nr:nucleotide sugar dehydrogenase [Alphaproteobacteria bacterium]